MGVGDVCVVYVRVLVPLETLGCTRMKLLCSIHSIKVVI